MDVAADRDVVDVTVVVTVDDLTKAITVTEAQESESLMKSLLPYHDNTRRCFTEVVIRWRSNLGTFTLPKTENINLVLRYPRRLIHVQQAELKSWKKTMNNFNKITGTTIRTTQMNRANLVLQVNKIKSQESVCLYPLSVVSEKLKSLSRTLPITPFGLRQKLTLVRTHCVQGQIHPIRIYRKGSGCFRLSRYI
jgi:hypothetical protein